MNKKTEISNGVDNAEGSDAGKALGGLESFGEIYFPEFISSVIRFEAETVVAKQVDGLIIGTGKADFTQGNTVYSFEYNDKPIQLVDVPGIEGNESKYEAMVRAAVARAHLIFYVNGTNKKPEQGTAKKIAQYLRYGTQVCPIVNLRGFADSYEFEEDRETLLTSHAKNALGQTESVLKDVLNCEPGDKTTIDGLCVQGLLGFSALAIDATTKYTTIDPSRHNDLARFQCNYLKSFSSYEEMYSFSHIESVVGVIEGKQATFKEDIIEANKHKVIRLLDHNKGIIAKTCDEYCVFIEKIRGDFDVCKASILKSSATFYSNNLRNRKNVWNKFFTDLENEADDIVQDYFGDNDTISKRIRRAHKRKQDSVSEELNAKFGEYLQELIDSVETALKRLMENIHRHEYERALCQDGVNAAAYDYQDIDMGLEWKDFGKIALNIGTYALTGAVLGSGLPVIGTAIGAVIGAVVGGLVSLAGVLTSKAKRIRKAQAKVHDGLESMRHKLMNGLEEELNKMQEPVEENLVQPSIEKVDELLVFMLEPISIMKKQIVVLNEMTLKLKGMPYGTVQSV